MLFAISSDKIKNGTGSLIQMSVPIENIDDGF